MVCTRVNGVFRRFTLKPAFPELTLAEARARAVKIIADARDGISPAVRQRREERGTFGAVAAAFMTDYAMHHKTRRQMQRKIDVDLAAWRDVPIASFTRGDIKELIREKARTVPIEANRLVALISRIFSWAVDEELVPASPAIRLPRPGKEVERTRFLSADEIKTVWAAFDQVGYPLGPLFKMLLVTGQRRGEVGGMPWSEIGADGWSLPNERAKRGKGHLVPLSSLAREIITDLPQIGPFVFTIRGDSPVTSFHRAKKAVDALAKIEPWRLHDLRRTMAQLRSLGIDRLVVSKLLNHREAGVTQIL
jgi:integrase